MSRPLRILLLCDSDSPGLQNAILDHIDAIVRLSRHWVVPFNPRSHPGDGLDLSGYDVVIIHFSLQTFWEAYLPAGVQRVIAGFRGLKGIFVQDEYRFVDSLVDAVAGMGIHLFWTVLSPETRPLIYRDARLADVRFVDTLTGYIGDYLSQARPPSIGGRPIDVGYRARTLPYTLGRLGREKVLIADGFEPRAKVAGLKTDISWRTEDRLNGPNWVRFLLSCKAMLGTEGGSSIIDFDGRVARDLDAYLDLNPDASFEAAYEEVLAPYDGKIVDANFSPRVLEMAALRVAMVMFPGEYRGIVEPWRHYIPLEKDFSNFEAVVQRLRDVDFLDQLTDNAHRDLVASGVFSYDLFIQKADAVIEEEFGKRVARDKAPISGSTARSDRRPGTGRLLWRWRRTLSLRYGLYRALLAAIGRGTPPVCLDPRIRFLFFVADFARDRRQKLKHALFTELKHALYTYWNRIYYTYWNRIYTLFDNIRYAVITFYRRLINAVTIFSRFSRRLTSAVHRCCLAVTTGPTRHMLFDGDQQLVRTALELGRFVYLRNRFPGPEVGRGERQFWIGFSPGDATIILTNAPDLEFLCDVQWAETGEDLNKLFTARAFNAIRWTAAHGGSSLVTCFEDERVEFPILTALSKSFPDDASRLLDFALPSKPNTRLPNRAS
ncbi:MAG: hypothetical protein CMM60_01975 [Rhodospirillaceae bacterium]|nr:hypothetical protein [Rhodospirillaceae bacterium]